jgi:hypothetical protein
VIVDSLSNARGLPPVNRVFDASLVPETCRDLFVDSKELINKFFEESRYQTSSESHPPARLPIPVTVPRSDDSPGAIETQTL